MSTVVSISELNYFHDAGKLSSLNGLVRENTVLNPDMIVGRTNCHFNDALYLLILLFDMNLANGFALIYDRNNLADGAIARRPIIEGFPRIPYKYKHMDQDFLISSFKDMLLIFEFELVDDNLQFVVN